MEKLKALIKRHPRLAWLARQAKRPFLWAARLLFCLGAFWRGKGLGGRRYRPLQAMRGQYAGQRCFIVATGPSLTMEDLALLQNEVTFSVNSIVLSLKDTPWRPTFYGIQDPHALRALHRDIAGAGLGCVFVGSRVAGHPRLKKLLPPGFILYPLDLLGHLTPRRSLSTRFSADCFLRVYDGYTVVYSMIQLAAYLGFTEIALLGADCAFDGPSPYFSKGAYATSAGAAVYQGMPQKLATAYAEARRWCEANGVALVNATRGGRLELLPRQSLEDILRRPPPGMGQTMGQTGGKNWK